MRHKIRNRGISGLMDLYLKELPNYIHALNQAAESGKGETIYPIAYQLKGNITNLGKQQLALCLLVGFCSRILLTEQKNGFLHNQREQSEPLKFALEKAKHVE